MRFFRSISVISEHPLMANVAMLNDAVLSKQNISPVLKEISCN